MSLGPLLPGRLPNSLQVGRLNQSLFQLNSRLSRLQDQLATGQKFFTPSESPVAALRTIRLQSTIERKEHFQANITTDKSFLTATESALVGVGDALNRAKAITLEGIGDTSTSAEKQALATEVGSLIRSVINAGNTKFRDRYIFAGTATGTPPLEFTSNGQVRYNGNTGSISSQLDFEASIVNNLDGNSALSVLTTSPTADLNPALSLDTKLSLLNGGEGVQTGPLNITLDNGGAPQTVTVDLSSAKTLRDVKTQIENAFAAGPLTVTVEIDPGSLQGLRLTPSAGTVEVADLTGSRTAAQLGIVSTAAATINGGDLNPQVTLQTRLADLNGGTGIGATAGTGLTITLGNSTQVVDLSSATTVEELFNVLKSANSGLMMEINPAGNGITVSSRLSGAPISIGENGGNNATLLGIRTLTGATRLADLNRGAGLPESPTTFAVTLSDGTELTVDLQGAKTVQNVIDTINAAAPGNLVAGLNSIGNGITLTDNTAGAGTFQVAENGPTTALGIEGSQLGGGAISGQDVGKLESDGVLNLLLGLQAALETGNNAELTRIGQKLDGEIRRVNIARGDVGNRLQMIEDIENRLLDEDVFLQESLSDQFEADFVEVVTQLTSAQTTLQATLQVTATSMQMTLLNYL